MDDYRTLGHMQAINETTGTSPRQRISYLPHHGIWQSSDQTNKLRVVFNDILHTGPAPQTDIITVLLHWRLPRVAIGAGVEKMYRKILVDPRDVDLQRVLWTDSASGSEQHYQLRTVTYGLSCASYLALRVLRQLGAGEGDKYPRAAQILRRSVYVDDILTGSDDVAAAKQLQNELTNLKAGYPTTLRSCVIWKKRTV